MIEFLDKNHAFILFCLDLSLKTREIINCQQNIHYLTLCTNPGWEAPDIDRIKINVVIQTVYLKWVLFSSDNQNWVGVLLKNPDSSGFFRSTPTQF